MAFNFKILFQMAMSMTDYLALMRFFTYSICNRLLLNILQVISQKYGLNL